MNKSIKMYVGVFGLLCGSFLLINFAKADYTGFVLTGCMERLFKITAYYTPEATQGVFFHGDYDTEKKINGGNWHGASGKHVYNGMLAGPKKYPFGTTVLLSGIGVGGIYDRGSAIIASGNFDRLDIRAGAGLQGMVNALWRGTQTITGTICSGGLDTSPHGFDRSNYPLREKASTQMLRTLDMQLGNSGLTVFHLNSFLQQMEYLIFVDKTPVNRNESKLATHKQYRIKNTEIFQFTTGTKLALCAFQQDSFGLSGDDEFCGYYGTNTRRNLANLVKSGSLRIMNIIESRVTGLIKKAKKRILYMRG